MRRRTRRRTGIQPLTSHCHTHLAGHWSCSEARFRFAILCGMAKHESSAEEKKEDTNLSDEHRSAKKWNFGKLPDCSLRILLGYKFDDSANRVLVARPTVGRKCTHPQPLDTPVGVTSTSANRTSPAANQNSHQYPLHNSNHSKRLKRSSPLALQRSKKTPPRLAVLIPTLPNARTI